MNPVDIIARKRDGLELTQDEIDFFVQAYTRDEIPDYQAAAWLMAVYLRGMTPIETTHLTLSMARSGAQLDLHDVAPFIVDKHSSGGVGDKTTLVVGPLVAACGLPVGKMSGRGLGFSGGTIDKLESIPGWSPELSEAQFRRQLADVGLVVAGQTRALAPADGKLYALRDVTATVSSIDLIASSIMSKKIAGGADAIVLDVKVGHGAFMKTLQEAEELASLMVQIGCGLNRRMTAVISDMHQPLGRAVGNALEVQEAVATLRGQGPPDFVELCMTIAGEMVRLAADASHAAENHVSAIREALESGRAWEKFCAFIAAQGGDVAALEQEGGLPRARLVEPVTAESDGYVVEIQAEEVGLTVVNLGGGRRKKGDAIDHAVGVVFERKVGDAVRAGEPLCQVYANDEGRLRAAQERLQGAVKLAQEPVDPPPLIHRLIRTD